MNFKERGVFCFWVSRQLDERACGSLQEGGSGVQPSKKDQKKELNWTATHTKLKESFETAWRWKKVHVNGYESSSSSMVFAYLPFSVLVCDGLSSRTPWQVDASQRLES